MPGQKVKNFLDMNSVEYVCIMHSPAFTAQGIAASAHISGKNIAKTIIFKSNDKMAMVVLTADHRLSIDILKDYLSTDSVKLANEDEFKDSFPDCEIGAMPPFGNLYGMDVYVSKELNEDDEFAFNAGSHSELIQMKYKDFKRLVKPKIADIAV